MLKYNCIILIICCIMKNSVDVINLLIKMWLIIIVRNKSLIFRV